MAAVHLDDLDRRIVGALQVNGRASWRRIADALGESFSTVTRRGNALIASGAVRVATLALGTATHLVYLDCLPGDIDDVASSLAADHRAVFVYRLGGSPSIAAEISAPESELAEFTRDIAAAHSAIRSVQVAPVLRYFQTVAGWRPPVLTDAEVQALEIDAPPENVEPSGRFDEPDATIVRALARDGRIALTTIAEEAGIPESTARRRVDHLFSTGKVHTRIVIEPANLGLPVEALLRIQANPAVTVEVGEMLAKLPSVRYAALVMGRDALVVNVTMSSFTELAQLLTGSDWVPRVSAVHSELVLASYKRSGVLTR